MFIRKALSFILLLLLAAVIPVHGQSALPSSGPEKFYSEIFSAQLLLYNGHVYTKFPEPYKGSPIFGDDLWNVGNISYDQQLYKGIDLFYDTHQDRLVVEHFDQNGYPTYFSPSYSNVDYFIMDGAKFVKLSDSVVQVNNMKAGYYQELFFDELGMYSKRKTGLYKEQVNGKYVPIFKNEDEFYLKYEDTYHSIRNKGSIKKVLRQYKKQINKFSREKNLLFFNDTRENSMLQLIRYCNTLLKEET